MDRRGFLKWAGAVSIALSPLALAVPLRERMGTKTLASAGQTRPLMGTVVTVTVLHPSADRAREAMEDAFAEMERLIPLLDRHAPDTPVSHLNRRGALKDIPPELREVMDQGLRLHRLTRGTFDISVKPVLDLVVDSFLRKQTHPPEEEIRRALSRVGAESIRCGEDEIRLLREGMGVSLDGIAKGYIVEKAVSKLKSGGIRHALVNAGGDILALGDKGNGQPWRIAIQDPFERKQILAIILLKDEAVATSGDYENFFDPQKKYHHLIDPQTGRSPRHLTSVSVRARSLTLADALATAAFIPPREKAQALIQAFPGAEALWVDRRKVQMKSGGWKQA